MIGGGTGDAGTSLSAAWARSPTPWPGAARRRAPRSAYGTRRPVSRPTGAPPRSPSARTASTSSPRAACSSTPPRRLLPPCSATPRPRPPRAPSSEVNMLLTRLPRLRDRSVDPSPGLRGHVPHRRGVRAARRRLPGRGGRPAAHRPALRDLLPLADRPDDPRPRTRRPRLPDPHPLRSARPGPAVHRRQRRRPRRPAPGDARRTGRTPGGADHRLPGPRRRR